TEAGPQDSEFLGRHRSRCPSWPYSSSLHCRSRSDLALPAPSRAPGKTVAHQTADLRRAYPIARRDLHIRDPLAARSAGVPDSCAPPPRPALVYNVPPERGLPRRHDLLEFVSPRFGRVDAPV